MLIWYQIDGAKVGQDEKSPQEKKMSRAGRGNDHTRDPCPYVIVYDVGIGFGLGAVLGTLFNTYKGFRNSPRGERLPGIISAVKTRAPILAGGFAVWSGFFNAFDCALVRYRGKEDTWNPILAGVGTGAILAVRSGPTVMLFSGLVGGVFLGAMEGVGHLMGKMMNGDSIDPQPIRLPEPTPTPQQQKQQQNTSQEPTQPDQQNGKPQSPFGLKFGFSS